MTSRCPRRRTRTPAAPPDPRLALLYGECHADLRVPLREGPHLRGAPAHERRAREEVRGLRCSRAPRLPPSCRALQGIGLLQHGLRQAEARGGRRRVLEQQRRREARNAQEVREDRGEEHAGGLVLLRLTGPPGGESRFAEPFYDLWVIQRFSEGWC